MSTLDQTTLNEIVDFLTPHMAVEANRHAFVALALTDAPMLMQRITYGGEAQPFTVNLVTACDRFGQIAAGRLAVVALLEQARDLVGYDGNLEIDRLISTITRQHTETPFEFVGAETASGHYFISYSSDNLAFVQRLTRDLQQQVRVWVDKVGLTVGTQNWEDALRAAIHQAEGVIFVATPTARKSPYVLDELAIADMEGKPIFPVWAEGTDDRRMDAIPMGRGYIQHVDLRGDRYETGLAQLLAKLTDPSVPTAVAEITPTEQTAPARDPDFVPRNPYKGLRAFRVEDERDFFGREVLVDELVSTMQFENGQQRFLAIIGASGSGKSSLIMAGLLPRLQSAESSADWVYLEPLVPGTHPVENLALCLADGLTDKSLTAIEEDLNNPRGLHRLGQLIARRKRLVLYIDQFEEVFTLTTDDAERQQFITLLTTAATEPNGPVCVLLSMRADFYDRPLADSTLFRLLEGHMAIPPLTVADLNRVVQGPAELPDVGVSFENGLVTDIVYEVRDEVGALPLLQFTLDQLFQRRDGLLLTRAAYDDLGGVRGALTQHAEQTFKNLPSAEHRQMARALFLRLIEPGQTEQDTTRRRADRDELTLTDPGETEILQATTAAFVNAYLLVSDKDTIEVAHEALIREWERLGTWLHDAREDITLMKRVAADAADWEQKGRTDELVYSGRRLQEALGWADRNAPAALEAAFLAAGEAHQQRLADAERQRQQRELELEREAREAAEYKATRQRQATRLAAIVAAVALIALGIAVMIGLDTAQQVNYLNDSVTFSALELERFEVLQAGDVIVPLGTQTPGVFELTLTKIAELREWIPIEQEFDGIEMVLVPAGCFYMGSDRGDSDEQPTHETCVEEFWIDKYEVTNEQYGSVADSVADVCEEWSSDPDQPRNCVKWYEAYEFCESRGDNVRLPTEAEWEYAARGPDSWIYPWGNEWDDGDNAVWDGNPENRTAPVGSRPGGVSWVGAYDLSGNIREWVNTIYDSEEFPYPYATADGREDYTGNRTDDRSRVLRGGSWGSSSAVYFRGAVRGRGDPSGFNDRNGFRCARS